MIWKRHLSLEELNATSVNTLVANLGIVYTRLGDDTLEAEMPVDARTHQPFGLLHGGAGGNARLNGRISDDPRRAERGGNGAERHASSGGIPRHGSWRVSAAASWAFEPELGDWGFRRAGAAVLYLSVEYDGVGVSHSTESDRLNTVV